MGTNPSMRPGPRPAALHRALLDGRRRFKSFLTRQLGSEQAAEDVLQTGYLRALERAPGTIDDEGAVRWFYRVLRNAAVDRSRRAAVEAVGLRASVAGAPTVLEPEWERAVCECIASALSTLRGEYAAIVRQVDLEGSTVTEAAREAGLTANNASVRLHRARRALRGALERVCGACATHGCMDCSCNAAVALDLIPR